MAVVNKYNLDWQMVRLEARKTKNVDAKLRLVTKFFLKNKSTQNLVRILNWSQMTKLGYGGAHAHKFMSFEVAMRAYGLKLPTTAEERNNFAAYPREKLKALLKDLQGRKWSFQFKQAPKEHIEFVIQLEEAINGKEKV